MLVQLQAIQWSAIQTATKATSPNSITTNQTVNRLAAPHKTQSLKDLLKVMLKAPYPLNKILA
ncbi:hypothetical protein KSH_01065 [Moraxella osloensis]|nr:hypothetical protein KSH_01065 [Moraxella osloensis]